MKAALIKTAADFEAALSYSVTRESATLEFKEQYQPGLPKHQLEFRKDILSLANTWGGSLLLGVVEGDGDGYRVAMDAKPVDQEAIMQWASQVMASRVFPAPRFSMHPLSVKNVAGESVRILSVNVHPLADVYGAYLSADDGLRFPRRDDFGVQHLTPLEVYRLLPTAAHMRRILITLHDIVTSNDHKLFIASPVIHQRLESDDEWHHKLKMIRPAPHWDTANPPAPYAKEVKRVRRDGDGFLLRGRSDSELFLSFAGTLSLTVPISLVKDAWRVNEKILGLSFDCEIIHSTVEKQAALFLETKLGG